MARKAQLADFCLVEPPSSALGEVSVILRLITPDFDMTPVQHAFETAVGLFQGDHPGYRACNTDYHDLRHTLQTFLCMARLLDGALLCGEAVLSQDLVLGLVAALLHDAGYIQEEHDLEGTGAKHTSMHVRRSADFFVAYGREQGMSDEAVDAGRGMILFTDLSLSMADVALPDPRYELYCWLLGAADIMAQMADRTYLEKLPFLFREFQEADVGGYEDEVDLLKKTVGFYTFIRKRYRPVLRTIDRYVRAHFGARWGLDENLYYVAIRRQRDYLLRPSLLIRAGCRLACADLNERPLGRL